MIKTKNNNIHRSLVITGYILFALLLFATLISTTIPWAQILINNSPGLRHINVAVFFVALTIGAFLPVLLGYIIGDHSIKSKSKLSHHFNGVAFGLLAFWIMTICAVLLTIPAEWLSRDPNARVILVNLFPSVVAAIVGSALAIGHVRSRQAKGDIVDYKPFSILLIASMVVLPLWSLFLDIIRGSVNIYSFTALLMIAVPGVISYITLRKKKISFSTRLAWAAISVSIFFVASAVVSMLLSGITTYIIERPSWEVYNLFTWAGLIIAFISWLIYWSKQIKVLGAKKNVKK